MITTRHTGALIVAALWLAAAPAAAQISAATPAIQDTAAVSLGEVRDRIEQRYQVLPLQRGIVLIPRYGSTDIQSIELADAAIAINGVAVTGAELSQRVGDDAGDILRLSYLDAPARRVLFGIGSPPLPPGAEPDTTAVVAADTSAADDDEDVEDVLEGVDVGDADSRVRLGGSIHVGADEVVDGDAVAVGGSVTVDGTVTGEVVAVGGSVTLGPEAEVGGAVTSVGGSIHRAEGAVVGGGLSEVAFGGPHFRFHNEFASPPFLDDFGGLIGTVIYLIVLMLLTSLAYLLAHRPVERMATRVAESPWKAALVGLVGQILFFPVLVLTVVVLAISIIGIPLLLLVPFALLALVIGTLGGFTAVALHVGRGADTRFGWHHSNAHLVVLIGVGLIMLVSFFASALGVAGGPIGGIAIALMVVGIIIQYIAWTTGFGALLLTRFGTRARWGDGGTAAPVAAPPAEPVLAPEPAAPAVSGELMGPRGPEPPPVL